MFEVFLTLQLRPNLNVLYYRTSTYLSISHLQTYLFLSVSEKKISSKEKKLSASRMTEDNSLVRVEDRSSPAYTIVHPQFKNLMK